jgi:hypothetical protein
LCNIKHPSKALEPYNCVDDGKQRRNRPIEIARSLKQSKAFRQELNWFLQKNREILHKSAANNVIKITFFEGFLPMGCHIGPISQRE